MNDDNEGKLDLIFEICVSNLHSNDENISNNQRKEYMKYLVNNEFHKKNVEHLNNFSNGDKDDIKKILLRASFKYAKLLKSQGKIPECNTILKWIVDNKKTFITSGEIFPNDLKVIGPAEALYYENPSNDEKFQIHDPKDKTLSDFQKISYYIDKNMDSEIKKFIQIQRNKISNGLDGFTSTKLLAKICEYIIKSSETQFDNYINSFIFFRAYCLHQISKNKPIEDATFRLFINFLKNMSTDGLNYKIKTEMVTFITFFDSDLYNYLPFEKQKEMTPLINSKIEFLFKLQDTKDTNIDTQMLFLYGLMLYKDKNPDIKRESEVYFRSAADKNYFKAKYFLSELLKDSDPQSALDLYDEIINYNNEGINSLQLNKDSDLLEKACTLYQLGLVYSKGLYSVNVNWNEVYKYWGNPLSDLCITKINDIKRFHYIDEEYPNLLFIRYKADHGLMEAKYLYFLICTKLKREKDILLIYMHELCMFSNYDIKYIKAYEEYARCLDVGEGVEMNKKKAKMIREKINEIKSSQ